jgi:hypothetical protein
MFRAYSLKKEFSNRNFGVTRANLALARQNPVSKERTS